MKGAHDSAAPAAAQAPKPSQWASWTNALLPLSQEASPQTVVASYTAQWPVAVAEPVGAAALRRLRLAGVVHGRASARDATQVPTLSGRLHA